MLEKLPVKSIWKQKRQPCRLVSAQRKSAFANFHFSTIDGVTQIVERCTNIWVVFYKITKPTDASIQGDVPPIYWFDFGPLCGLAIMPLWSEHRLADMITEIKI